MSQSHTPLPIPAVKAVVVVQNRLLILRRADSATISPGRWELSGGKMEYGETPEETLVREVQEETGLLVQAGALLYAYTIIPHPGHQALILVYRATAGGTDTTISLSSEHQDGVWANRQQAEELLGPVTLQHLRTYGILDLLA